MRYHANTSMGNQLIQSLYIHIFHLIQGEEELTH